MSSFKSVRLVVTTFGEFRVVGVDEWGNHTLISSAFDMARALELAAAQIGPLHIDLELMP